MSAQHTPGPWSIADNGVFAPTLNGHGNFYVVTLPFPTEEPNARDKANLALIASAPELLRALRDLRENVDKDLSGYWTESTANLMQQADAAFAKAEGAQ